MRAWIGTKRNIADIPTRWERWPELVRALGIEPQEVDKKEVESLWASIRMVFDTVSGRCDTKKLLTAATSKKREREEQSPDNPIAQMAQKAKRIKREVSKKEASKSIEGKGEWAAMMEELGM